MKNKLLIILGVIFAIIALIAYKGYRTYWLLTESGKFFKNQEAVLSNVKGRWNTKSNDDNFPEYAKPYMPNESITRELTDISNFLYSNKNDIYSYYKQEELLKLIKNIIPNNLDRFKNQLVPIIKNKITQKKKNVALSFKESESYPAPAKNVSFRNCVLFWYSLSRFLEKKNDTETSLLLSHSIFYLAKDMITDNALCGTVFFRTTSLGFYEKACNSILIWASSPKPYNSDLSKIVAKDILDFVENEYSFSSNLKFEREIIEEQLNAVFKHFANGALSYYPNTNQYKEFFDILFDKPLKFIDKPIYEIENDIDNFEKEKRTFFMPLYGLFTQSFSQLLKVLFNPESIVALRFLQCCESNITRAKRKYEETLARMEFTAIALSINSFYSEKKSSPLNCPD